MKSMVYFLQKLLIVMFLVVISNNLASAQQAGNSSSTVYTNVDRMPSYPGGEEAIEKFIKSNLKYPATAKAKKIAGKVYVEFVISEKGEVEKTEILRNLEPSLDSEAIRLVRSLRGWKPGINLGKPVKVSMVLPIEFSL